MSAKDDDGDVVEGQSSSIDAGELRSKFSSPILHNYVRTDWLDQTRVADRVGADDLSAT